MQHSFLKSRAELGPSNGQMTHRRQAAATRFAAYGWPTPTDEAWRFTNINALSARDWSPVVELASVDASGHLEKGAKDGACLVIVNGVIDPSLSTELPQGMTMTALDDDAEMAAMLDDKRIIDHQIANISLAVMSSSFGIRIGGKAAAPLRLVFINEGDDTSAHAVGVIMLEDGASATILEEHSGTGTGLSAPLLAINIGDDAALTHARVQIEDVDVDSGNNGGNNGGRHHLSQTVMNIGARGRYNALMVQSGGALSRAETHIALVGEDIDMGMTTIYLAAGKQVMDVTSLVDHRVPNCTSRQIVRGVLDDTARGVFQGKVIVARDAQKTDGNQMSRTLLLSRKCEADAKPELEIYADDVACSHGATVGEIDDNHLFYLTSRGIPKQEARQMLIEAFLADVLDEVEDETLVGFAQGAVQDWLNAMKARG